MPKTRSFVLALLLLFAMLVAAASAVVRFERESRDATAAGTTFIPDARICHFTPGHEFAYPTAVEIAEARAYGNFCPYDPSQGFRLLPSSGELDQARHAVSTAGSVDGAIGTIVPLPSTDADGLIGAGIAVAAGVGLLALRYLRRTAAAAGAALETTSSASRSWLTRRRVAAVGAGWLMTVGVLAAAYPMISAMIPHQQQLPGEPAAAMPGQGSTTTTPYDPAEDAAPADVRPAPATGAATDFTLPPPAPSDSNGGADSIDSSGTAPASLSFFVAGAAGGASGGGASNGGAGGTAVPDASAATQAFGPVTTSLAALSTYLPASNQVTDAGDGGASAGTSPATDGGASAGPPTGSPAGTTTTGDTPPSPETPAAAPTPATPADDGQNPLATMPVIDPANPLPAGPDAVIPAPGGGGGGATVPANPASLDDGDDGATAVPEPAMLGLFGMGALLVLRRRRGK